MNKRYYVELSRSDLALVSYFPGLEIQNKPDHDWISSILVPSLEQIAKRRNKKIWDVPITFWISTRSTARMKAEIFLFMTPAYPGKLIEDTTSKFLQPLVESKVHAGREYIPEDAYPCIQIFRGHMIRFYQMHDNLIKGFIPQITWKDNEPEIEMVPFYDRDELEETGDMKLLAEARILTCLTGEECRKFQQILKVVAREVDESKERKNDEHLPRGSQWMENPEFFKEVTTRKNDIDIENLWE